MRRLFSLTAMMILAVAPLTASQFVPVPFDQLVVSSPIIVHGNVGRVWSAETVDANGRLIHTYAEVLVSGYLAGSGGSSVIVKEVGGTVNGYTQEVVGFPMLRTGEEVVLFLAPWDEAFRIQGYAQGKYLVSHEGGQVTVSLDPVQQGHERLHSDVLQGEARPMDELVTMVRQALAAKVQPLSQN